MRAKRRTLAALTLVSALVATPFVEAGFLGDVDKAMKDYATNIQKEGDDNLATMKTIVDAVKKGEFKAILPAVDAGMKSYGTNMQKTGDDAWVDLKPILKDLVDPKTYLPAPLKKMWEAFVAELAVLKARFLRRVEHPWADDPPAGGGNGGDPQPPPNPPPAPPTPPTTGAKPAGGGADPGVPSSQSTTATSGATGALPASSEIRASAIVASGPPIGVDGMNACYEEYLNVRKTALAASDWKASKLDAKQQGPVGEKIELMAGHARDMEDRLFAKLRGNKTAVKALVAYVGKLDASARAHFRSLVSRLQQSWNAQALHERADAAKADIAKLLAKLKSSL